MKIWALAASSLLLSGCFAEDTQVTLTKAFWQAINAGDKAAVKQLISDPEQAEVLDNLHLESDYTVLGRIAEGVDVRFSAHCYADITTPTIITEVDGHAKVDFDRTLRQQFKAMAKQKPLKQYCYEFKDQPLQGMINGQPWQAKLIKREGSLALLSEPCSSFACATDTQPQVLIGQLDLTGTGGNLGHESITLYTPPSNNQITNQGSYRVTRLDDGKMKLELSVAVDDANYLNGYFIE